MFAYTEQREYHHHKLLNMWRMPAYVLVLRYETTPIHFQRSHQMLMRSLGFEVQRNEVLLMVHRANAESDGRVDLATLRLISEFL